MCVSPVLYLHYCQCSMTCKLVLHCMYVCYHYCQRNMLTMLCVSSVLCLHYCQRRVLCLQVLCCVCTNASAVCCACKSYVVFTLLPVQCCVCTTASAVCCLCNSCVVFAQCTASAVCHVGATISPLIILFCYFYYFIILCLHYCQRSVLCV